MEGYDFDDWCIITKPNKCDDIYNFEELAISTNDVIASLNNEDDYVLLTNEFENEIPLQNDSLIDNENKYIEPGNFEDKLETRQQLLDKDNIDNSYPNALINYSEEECRILPFTNSNVDILNEDSNFEEIVPLFEFYDLQNIKKNNNNSYIYLNNMNDSGESSDIVHHYLIEENLLSITQDMIEDDSLSRTQDMMQSFDYEVGPDDIDHICIDEEFHLPLTNKYRILDMAPEI